MGSERRQVGRVRMGNGYTARITAIDGTWQRECRINDVSDTGAKLNIFGSIETIDTREFFLQLTATGNAHRRCQRVWINGTEAGVRFIKS
jgi:hypothetical protein